MPGFEKEALKVVRYLLGYLAKYDDFFHFGHAVKEDYDPIFFPRKSVKVIIVPAAKCYVSKYL